MPVEQSVQLAAPAEEYLPALHNAVTAPWPVAAQYEPAVHDPHDVWPALAWKVPVEQSVQLLAPAAEYLPAPHDAVTAARPAVAQYEPGVQLEHAP